MTSIMETKHITTAEIEAGICEIRQSPKDQGVLDLIVRRPRENEREVLETGRLDVEKGLVGDIWSIEDGNRQTQIAIMNSRTIALLARGADRRPLAGDQLYIDLDLSGENLPAGTRLAIGGAILEITPEPHPGC